MRHYTFRQALRDADRASRRRARVRYREAKQALANKMEEGVDLAEQWTQRFADFVTEIESILETNLEKPFTDPIELGPKFSEYPAPPRDCKIVCVN